VFRALLTDDLHFKYKGGLFYANSPERLEQIRIQYERQAQREKELAEGSAWLAAVWKGEAAVELENRQHYVQMLQDFCLLGNEAPNYQQIKKILTMAHVPVPQGVFELLVKLGVWRVDENLYLHRFGIQQEFSSDILDAATQVAGDLGGTSKRDEGGLREDLTSISVLTIDGSTTRDYDDGLSMRAVENGTEVGIHIADASTLLMQQR
jgi:exoribonuclease-2